MNDTLITIFTVVSGGLTTAVGMLWKFVQSRFAVQDRLLQECEVKHVRSEEKYEAQINKMVEMSHQMGELRAKVDYAMSVAARESRELGHRVDHVEEFQGANVAKNTSDG